MSATNEEVIRHVIEARARAVRAGDVDAIMEHVADDVVTFDVVDPLRLEGSAASRARAAEWVQLYDGPISWENRDVCVVTDGDVAFGHALSRVTGTRKTGAAVDMWFRTTLGFRRVDGRWLITHDHGSVPFNPENGKASLTLTP